MSNEWVPPNGAAVKAMREAAGYSIHEMAAHFGMNYRSWQAKESDAKSHRSLSYMEYSYFLMLCDKHPYFRVTKKGTKD